MANEHPDRDELDTVPADLQALHRQLQADSANWSRHVPSSERLITHYQTLLSQQPGDLARASIDNRRSLQPLFRSERGYMNTTQKRLSGIFAGVIVVALIAATIVLFQHHPGKAGPAVAPTATLAPTATATPAPALHVAANQGWVYPSALTFGKTIAFAPNAPLTGYVCGNAVPAGSTARAPIRFSVTHDGGATWHELATTPLQAGFCELSIAPTNANDLVIFDLDGGAYRSQDGGQTWSLLQIPTGDSVPVSITQATWAESTLFADVATADHSPSSANIHLAHTLAVSVNGGALTWVNTSHVFPPTPNVTQLLQGGYGVGTTFYATIFATPTTCPYKPNTPCSATVSYVTTDDNGATWTPYTLSSQLIDLPSPLVDGGHTLLGDLYPAPGYTNDSAISKDGGKTWTRLPALPSGGNGIGATAPDDTIYDLHGNGSGTPPDSLLKHSPGAASWTIVAATVPGLTTVASSDGAGHPNAVWSTVMQGDAQQPGIAYHAP